MKQLKVAFDDKLRDAIQARADANRVSFAAEVRSRLERTLALDEMAPPLRELLDGIASLAEEVFHDRGGSWFFYQGAHAIFATMVAERIAGYQPPKREPPAAGPGLSNLGLGGPYLDPIDPPDAIGRTLERAERRKHSYPHLESALTRRTWPHVATPWKGDSNE